MYLKARSEALIIKDLGDDLVVYDERADCAHELNGAAAAVWRRCDGQTDLDEIASQLPAELGLPADEEIVTLAITELSRAGLLETSGGVQHVSRRQCIEFASEIQPVGRPAFRLACRGRMTVGLRGRRG